MPFAHPTVFYMALAASTLPVVIHLLSRRRHRIVDWAAMEFLSRTIRKNRRRLRLEDLLLLAVRCLLILFLGFALARFTGWVPASTSEQPFTVIVLDDSASMGQLGGSSTLFEQAREYVADLVGDSSPSQEIVILRTSAPDTSSALRGADKLQLARRVEALDVTDGRGRLVEAVDKASGIIEQISPPARLVIVGDFRQHDLDTISASSSPARIIDELIANGVQLVVRDVGRPARSNLSAQRLELIDPIVRAGVPARLRLTVRNDGPEPSSPQPFDLWARHPSPQGTREGAMIPPEAIKPLSPGESGEVDFTVLFDHPGPAVVTATLGEDDLKADNTARLALDIRASMRVLVVDGSPESRDDSFFFTKALDPMGDGRYGVNVDVAGIHALSSTDLDHYDVVTLMNVRAMGDDAASASDDERWGHSQLDTLERFVEGGGGLAVFSGPDVDLAFYNDMLWKNGDGLVPLKLISRADERDSEFFRLDPAGIASQRFLRCFEGELSAAAALIRFRSFIQADDPSASARAKILARFATAERWPAMAAKQFGKGNVVMFYSTAGTRWNDWCIPGPMDTYPVAMHNLVEQLARPGVRLSGTVETPIIQSVWRLWEDATAFIKSPDYPATDETALHRNDNDHWRHDATSRAGIYELRAQLGDGRQRVTLFTRDVDPAEGHLMPATRDDIASAFGTDNFMYIASEQDDAAIEGRTGTNWMVAMLVVLAILVAEMTLARRFSHHQTEGSAA